MKQISVRSKENPTFAERLCAGFFLARYAAAISRQPLCFARKVCYNKCRRKSGRFLRRANRRENNDRKVHRRRGRQQEGGTRPQKRKFRKRIHGRDRPPRISPSRAARSSASAIMKGEKEIDIAGKIAVPGLIDAHVHIESSQLSSRGVCGAGDAARYDDRHRRPARDHQRLRHRGRKVHRGCRRAIPRWKPE